MSKLAYFHQKKLNPADELRELLGTLEDRGPALKALDSTKALILLRDLDQITDLFTQLEATDLNLLSEQSRFKAVESYLKKNAAIMLKALGGSEALDEFRPSPPPARERWWWYSQELVAAQRRRLLKRIAIAVLVVVGVAGAISLIFNTILAPSPEVLAEVEAENKSMAAIEAGDYELAMTEIEKGLAVVPDNPYLLVIEGTLYETLGEDDKAARSFQKAESNFDDLAKFHLSLGQTYFRIGQYFKAEVEARSSIASDDNIAASWFLLGQSLEGQNKAAEAKEAYQHAGDLALANNDTETLVLVRLAMSRVGLGP